MACETRGYVAVSGWQDPVAGAGVMAFFSDRFLLDNRGGEEVSFRC